MMASWAARWEAMRRVLRRVGRFQSAVILSLLYLVCWAPVGLLTRLLADWLQRRAPARSNWWPRPARLNDPTHVKDPF